MTMASDSFSRGDAMMGPRTRYVFRRNLPKLIVPAPERHSSGFDESMLRTGLVVSDLNRERLDPRRQPPVRTRIGGRAIAGLR
jgi:hypothetical protein